MADLSRNNLHIKAGVSAVIISANFLSREPLSFLLAIFLVVKAVTRSASIGSLSCSTIAGKQEDPALSTNYLWSSLSCLDKVSRDTRKLIFYFTAWAMGGETWVIELIL